MIDELKNLPDISFIDNMSIEKVQSLLISQYEKKYAELAGLESYSLPKASIYRIIINANAVLMFQALQYIDRAGKSNMLKDTYGEYLDNLAALKGVKRNEAQPASVTVRFTLESARSSAVGIPAGTRVSNGGEIYFKVKEYTEIPPGALFVDINVKCSTSGTVGNGFAVGEINVLVDPVNYITSVSNIEESANGADVESDDALRKRVFYAPSAYSCAGPLDAYYYWVQSFSNDIADIKITTDEGSATVDIRILLENGKLPDEAFINNLLEYISTDDKKPLTDLIRVAAPTPVEYGIDFTYYINESDKQQAVMIQTAVAQAVEDYKKWQNGKIGRDINPDMLRKFVMAAGAKRLDISMPVLTEIDNNEVATLYDGSTQRTLECEYESGGIDHTSGSLLDIVQTNHWRTPYNNPIDLTPFSTVEITVNEELISKYAVKIWMCDETGCHAVDNSYSQHSISLSNSFTHATYDKAYFGNFIRIEVYPRNISNYDETEIQNVIQSIVGGGSINIAYGGLEND